MGLVDYLKKRKASRDSKEYSPTDIFFENFILDTIGHLPKEKSEQIRQIDLASIFKTDSTDWKEITKEVLHLSDTVEIAILDLWYKNQSVLKVQGEEYQPLDFAKDFISNYFKEDSQVDIWEGDNLEQAKERIKQASQDKHNEILEK